MYGLKTGNGGWPVPNLSSLSSSGKSSTDLLLPAMKNTKKTVAMFWAIVQITVLLFTPLRETLFVYVGRWSCLCLESNSFCYGAWTNEIMIQSQWIKKKSTDGVYHLVPYCMIDYGFFFLVFLFLLGSRGGASVSFFLGKVHSRLLPISRPFFLGSKSVTMSMVKETGTKHKQVLAIATFYQGSH